MDQGLVFLVLAFAGATSACATMPSEPPTAAQRASCEEMMKMGEGATQNHSAERALAPRTRWA